MKPCYMLLASRPWLERMASNLEECTGCTFYTAKNPQELDSFDLSKMNPRYIFVPHWSWIIPKTVWGNYETVIFHMTDLPFGRGGSPLQNLIIHGVNETKITALRCSAEVDAGPVYLKRNLSLNGSAQEVFERSTPIIQDMILHIIQDKLQPIAQHGKPTFFKRRTPEQSNIAELSDLSQVHDYIRMLDAEGYPHAFLEHNFIRLEFTNARMQNGKITAKVSIALKESSNA